MSGQPDDGAAPEEGDAAASVDELCRRAAAAAASGDLGSAFSDYEAALAEADLLGDPHRIGQIRLALGRVAADFGDAAEARRWLGLALDALADADDLVRAEVHLELARTELRDDFPDAAKQHLNVALRAYRASEERAAEARCRVEFADAAVRQGDLKIAELELRSAARLAAADDAVTSVARYVVLAALADAQGDDDGVLGALEQAAATAAEAGLSSSGHLDNLLTRRRDGERDPIRRWPKPVWAGDAVAVKFVNVVLDPQGEIGPSEVVDSTALDAASVQACASFIHGVTTVRNGVPVRTEPEVRVYYNPGQRVFGLALVAFEVAGEFGGAGVIATGSDEDEDAFLASFDPIATFVAGRFRSENYYGFGRQPAMRPGAIRKVTERPVSFFIPPPRADHPRAIEATFQRHLEMAAAYIGMIAANGSAAQRLRDAMRKQ